MVFDQQEDLTMVKIEGEKLKKIEEKKYQDLEDQLLKDMQKLKHELISQKMSYEAIIKDIKLVSIS